MVPTMNTQATKASTPMVALLAKKVRKFGNSMLVGQDYAGGGSWIVTGRVASPAPAPFAAPLVAWRRYLGCEAS